MISVKLPFPGFFTRTDLYDRLLAKFGTPSLGRIKDGSSWCFKYNITGKVDTVHIFFENENDEIIAMMML